jgi:hypothetical protein
MARSKMSPAYRRYTVSIVLLMSAYALILFGVNAFFRNSAPSGVSALLAALLPSLPIIGVFVAVGRLLVEDRDEYRRSLLVRQCLIATAFALAVATAWGFLEDFGQVRHMPGYWATVLWFAGLGVGGCINALSQPKAEED